MFIQKSNGNANFEISKKNKELTSQTTSNQTITPRSFIWDELVFLMNFHVLTLLPSAGLKRACFLSRTFDQRTKDNIKKVTNCTFRAYILRTLHKVRKKQRARTTRCSHCGFRTFQLILFPSFLYKVHQWVHH